MKKLCLILFIVGLCVSVQNSHAQNKMLIGGQVSLDLPMGVFADNYNTGFGVNGEFLYQLQPKLWLTGLLGYYSFGVKAFDATLTDVSIVPGIRYEVGKGNFVPYIGGEVGLHFLSFSTQQITVFGTSATASVSETDLGFAPLIGFMTPLTPSIILDVNLKYVIILKDIENLSYIGLQGGILFPL